MIKRLYLAVVITCLACTSQSEKTKYVKKATEWREMQCGLFMSPNGIIGLATDPDIANVPLSKLPAEKCPNEFITTFGYQDTLTLNAVIDTSTFHEVGTDLYVDKNNIYSFYSMCAGGQLNIFASDTSSLRVLNLYYFIYKNDVYHFREGAIDADPKSFKTGILVNGQLAKDKNGYFLHGERKSEKELLELLTPVEIDHLDKY